MTLPKPLDFHTKYAILTIMNIITALDEYKINFALDYALIGTPAEREKDLYDLISEMANDPNSSKFREDVTKMMIGLRPSEGKHGYDDDFEAIEVKPQNYTGAARKLNGAGKFTDFTWARHQKYAADNVRMVVSGFNRGKLLYIVEFPYDNLESIIVKNLSRLLPNGDETNRYVRALQFGYQHWVDKPHVISYVSPKLDEHKAVIVGPLYNHLITEA